MREHTLRSQQQHGIQNFMRKARPKGPKGALKGGFKRAQGFKRLKQTAYAAVLCDTEAPEFLQGQRLLRGSELLHGGEYWDLCAALFAPDVVVRQNVVLG